MPKKKIVENEYDLSVNRYKEEIYEDIEYEAPRKIFERLKFMENEIQDEINMLSSYFN